MPYSVVKRIYRPIGSIHPYFSRTCPGQCQPIYLKRNQEPGATNDFPRSDCLVLYRSGSVILGHWIWRVSYFIWCNDAIEK